MDDAEAEQPGAKSPASVSQPTNSWSNTVTALSVAAAVGACVFTGLQWREAHEGGAVAERQAEAAESLSVAASSQARSALDFAAATKQQLGQMQSSVQAEQASVSIAKHQAAIAANEADTISKQLDEQRLALSLVHRPMLHIGGLRLSDVSQTGNGSPILGGAQLNIQNLGELPAQDIAIRYRIIKAKNDDLGNSSKDVPACPSMKRDIVSQNVDEIPSGGSIQLNFGINLPNGRSESVEYYRFVACISYSARALNISHTYKMISLFGLNSPNDGVWTPAGSHIFLDQLYSANED